jgi:hypothetical protein
VGIRQNKTDVEKRMPIPETQMDYVSNPGLFKIRKILSIINVSLRIKVSIANFNGVVEIIPIHIEIIPAQVWSAKYRKSIGG